MGIDERPVSDALRATIARLVRSVSSQSESSLTAPESGRFVAAGVEDVQRRLLVREFGRDLGDATIGLRVHQFGRDPQREGKAGTPGDEFGCRVWRGTDPRPDQLPEQREPLRS